MERREMMKKPGAVPLTKAVFWRMLNERRNQWADMSIPEEVWDFVEHLVWETDTFCRDAEANDPWNIVDNMKMGLKAGRFDKFKYEWEKDEAFIRRATHERALYIDTDKRYVIYDLGVPGLKVRV